MDRANSAHIDEKTGHEIQTMLSGKTVDVDALLDRIGIKHDAEDMWSAARSAVRAELARDAGASDKDIKATVAVYEARVARMAAERQTA